VLSLGVDRRQTANDVYLRVVLPGETESITKHVRSPAAEACGINDYIDFWDHGILLSKKLVE
jgi:hypothetical protein